MRGRAAAAAWPAATRSRRRRRRASIAKHQPSPTAAMSIPPIDGPMMRLPLTIDELSAIAFGRSRAVLDHLDDERLPGRRIEGVDQALHDLQHQDLRDRDQSATASARRAPPTGASEAPASMTRIRRRSHAIDDHPGKRRQQQRRDLPAEADDAEQQLRAGEPVDQPARGDARDPRADQRDALSAEEQAVVAVPQRARQLVVVPAFRRALVVSVRRTGRWWSQQLESRQSRSTRCAAPGARRARA